jgi:hypothetical protein
MQTTPLTVRSMVKETGALVLLIGIACIPSIGQEIALGILIVTALGRPAWTLKSLVAGTMVTFVSSPLASAGDEASVLVSVLKWVLLFVACGRSLVSGVEPTRIYVRLLYCWVAVTAVLLINSFFVSAVPSISVFKTISFSVALLCVIRLAMLTSNQSEEMLLFVAQLGTAVVIVSLPLLPLGLGYSRGAGGFNGVLNHPQALGIFLVMTGSAAFATGFKVPRLGHVLIVIGLAQWSLIFLTGARTALVAIALGGLVYLLETVVRGGKDNQLRYLSPHIVAIAITGLVLVIIVSPRIREGFAAYLQKGDKESIVSADNRELSLRESSRGGQIFDALELAEEHPLFGYGFGVGPDSESNMASNGAQLGGIPLSAPVEQGFLPLASIAQIGIVGSCFVFAFLIVIYGLARRNSGETAALFAAVLGVNIGEMIFYSPGGLGLFMWMLLMLFAASGTAPRQSLAASYR